ncbi:MAG: hypothetical protein AAGE83_02690 [Pseudomonadota bacterium]
MKIRTKFIQDGERHLFDFERCKPSDGWAQFDTDSDAWYYGHWINPLTHQLVGYAEGDATYWQAESAEEFAAEVRRWLETPPGGRIDHMCRPKIIAALTSMGLCAPEEAPRIEELNAPRRYTLTEGWTWTRVAEERQRWDVDERRFPLACAPGAAVAWGVPLDGETAGAGA